MHRKGRGRGGVEEAASGSLRVYPGCQRACSEDVAAVLVGLCAGHALLEPLAIVDDPRTARPRERRQEEESASIHTQSLRFHEDVEKANRWKAANKLRKAIAKTRAQNEQACVLRVSCVP